MTTVCARKKVDDCFEASTSFNANSPNSHVVPLYLTEIYAGAFYDGESVNIESVQLIVLPSRDRIIRVD